MLIAAAVLFALHTLVATIDGAYFHLYKYRLYARPDSVVEHFTHTLRAVTMTIAALVFFAFNVGGLLLWAAVGVIVIDIAIETWDVLIEKKSRAGIGGLSPAEYLSHAHAIFLYAGAYALVLAAKRPGAFAFDAPSVLPLPYAAPVRWLGWAVAVGAGLSAVQHAVYLHPRFRERRVVGG